MKWKHINIGTVRSHEAVGCPECYRDTGGVWPSKTGNKRGSGEWSQCCEQCQYVVLVYDLERPRRKKRK